MSGKSLSLINQLQKRMYRTPDFHELRKRPECALFVYDCLKKGGWENEKFLDNALFLGEAQTLHVNYRMKIDKTGNPIVFPVAKDDKAAKACIHGEMFLVSPRHIALIDEYYQNSTMVNRTLARFILFDQNESKVAKSFRGLKWCWGFIYLGNMKEWAKHTTSFRSTKSYHGAGLTSTFQTRPRYEWQTWEKNHLNWRNQYPSQFPTLFGADLDDVTNEENRHFTQGSILDDWDGGEL